MVQLTRSSSDALPARDWQTGRIRGARQVEPTGQNPVRQLPDYDVITIGGGINGSGIARDAAERGLKVLLLEKGDWGGGTSAYSSRLIHGGLRYLANFELDLVHESLQERERLLRNAPHLVRPLPLALPIYQHNAHPSWKVRIGMWLYDLLSHGKSVPVHRMYGTEAFLKRYPFVNPVGLQGGPVYYDAQVALPERICVENAVAAEQSGNATVLNHARVTGIVLENQAAAGVTFTDLQTGEQFLARGKVVINAAGPWVDEVLNLAVQASPSASVTQADAASALVNPRIGGTKGTHIVVRRFPGGPRDDALYVEAESDGRPFFIIPWRRDYYLIGTTDTRYQGRPDDVAPTRDEVTYLLQETNRVLPQAQLRESDVLYAYAGIRPLPYTQEGQEGKITRKHLIEDHRRHPHQPVGNMLSIIGGKLTTYRNLAEESVDYAVRQFRLRLPSGRKPGRSTTRQTPLPGAQGIQDFKTYRQTHVHQAVASYGVPPETAAHLIDVYGSRYGEVLALADRHPEWKEPLLPGSPVLKAQVAFAVKHEWARTVDDVLRRRIGNGFDEDAGVRAAEPTARVMGLLLGWDEARIRQETDAYLQRIEHVERGFLRR